VTESPNDFYTLRMMYRIALWAGILFASVPNARAEFGFHAGSHFGYGRMSSDSGASARNMGTFDLQFMPGYRILGFMPGLLLDFRLLSQLEEGSRTQANFSGRGLLMGLGVTYEPGPVKILVSYDFRNRHWYSGPDTTYAGSGYHLLLGYKFMPGFSFDIEYVRSTYNSVEVDGIANGLNNNNVNHWNLGFGVSYSY
jgi:hypothetical protein